MLLNIFLDKKHTIEWVRRTHPVDSRNNTLGEIRYIDLFSGCGGLSLGIETAGRELGFTTISALAVDSKKAALEVYKKNIQHEIDSIVHADILDLFKTNSKNRVTRKELLLKSKVGKIDVLMAGPPCQGHSDLNNSTRRHDPRNNLYISCIRAIKVFEPHIVIIENVPAVIHASEGVVQSAQVELERMNYHVKQLDVNFLNLGIPQSRKRHVLIASKDREFCDSLTTIKQSYQTPTLREFIAGMKEGEELIYKSGKLSQENIKRVNYLFDNSLYNLPDSHRPSCHKDKVHSYNSVYGRLKYDAPAQTLTSGYGSMGQGRYIHPKKRRTINSREASRIQGFPDYFDFTSVEKLTDLRQMIANAVPLQLSYVIGSYFMMPPAT